MFKAWLKLEIKEEGCIGSDVVNVLKTGSAGPLGADWNVN